MTASCAAGSPIPAMTRLCRFVIATTPIGVGGEAPSGLRPGEALEQAAVGAPAAVGLALHGVEGQPAAAFGVGKAHGLYELAVDEERRFDDCAYGARVLGRDGVLGRGEMRGEGEEQRSEETGHVAISDAEQLLERSRGRADRLRIGALLGLVLRGGKAVAGAAVDLQ